MASTLLANNAKVYIVDLEKEKVEKVAEEYSKLAKGSGSKGEMVGLHADCGSKVSTQCAHSKRERLG